jgi:hypothetical protein
MRGDAACEPMPPAKCQGVQLYLPIVKILSKASLHIAYNHRVARNKETKSTTRAFIFSSLYKSIIVICCESPEQTKSGSSAAVRAYNVSVSMQLELRD